MGRPCLGKQNLFFFWPKRIVIAVEKEISEVNEAFISQCCKIIYIKIINIKNKSIVTHCHVFVHNRCAFKIKIK